MNTETVARALRSAQRVAVLTGAGVSAESGVPTFRDAQTGLWARYRPEDLATRAAFERDPRLVWEWYEWRRKLVTQAQPNAAHHALAELEQRVPHFALITQNVDGLHARAGSRALIELHGSLERFKCYEEDLLVEEWLDDGQVPPRCPRCGGRVRPDVVWFGEPLPRPELAQALDEAEHCDLFLAIGTSGLVEPAASLPRMALSRGALLVTINPAMPAVALADRYTFSAPAGAVLPDLLRAAWPE